MANQSIRALWPPALVTAGDDKAEGRRRAVVQLQWALAFACAYLVLFSHPTIGPGALVIVAFLVLNVGLSRLPAEVTNTALFSLGLALVDAFLIAVTLYAAGQLSAQVVMLCVAILILAIAGLPIGAIAGITLAMMAVYLLVVSLAGGTSLWQASVLLRVPLLFVAAILYAWLVEIGRRGSPTEEATSEVTSGLDAALCAQLEAIKRCQAAMAAGSTNGIASELNDIAAQNQAIQTKVATAHA